jgi:glycosyltransferase involved in cell wall biosynthesis
VKAAIVQNNFSTGGRTRVVLSIIEVLNKRGIIPDVFCYNGLTVKDARKVFGKKDVKFNRIIIPSIEHVRLSDYKVPLLNLIFGVKCKKYDLFINSGNCQNFFPKNVPCISYIHFPIKWDILSKYYRPFPERKLQLRFSRKIYKSLLKLFYRFDRISKNQIVVANSKFTQNAISEVYNISRNKIKVIYPPVKYDEFLYTGTKERKMIASLGRITEHKRQLEQIRIMESLPEFKLNIIGEVDPINYYNECLEYVRKHKITNVSFYPKCAFEKLKKILKESEFFIHSFRNEPFGISTVEAVAAGCIPIVHNSGGQKETVPLKELRFNDIDEAINTFKKLEMTDNKSTINYLQNYIKQYDEENFRIRIRSIITEIL